MVAATSNAEALAAGNRARAAASQNLEELGKTLTKMQALLKEMRAKANGAKDPVAKANLEMWTLMLDQLDKEYEQLRVAARQREDVEARRAALYKQADEKAAEAARRAKASNAAAAASNASSPTPATSSSMSTAAPRPASSGSPN
jgi:chemotaxis protein histidine kinase CheA